jgi:hypothetical protein
MFGGKRLRGIAQELRHENGNVADVFRGND